MGHSNGGGHNKGNGAAVAWLKANVSYQGDDCLPWPFSRDGRVGRGRLGYDGNNYWAHRLMCIFAHGEPPTPKHQAAHSCGKGHYGCCNPRHLSWKTNSQNQIDRRKNGNMLRNSTGNKGALSPEQRSAMLAMKGEKTQMEIAAHFGVSLGCVQYWFKYRADRGNDKGLLRVFSEAEDARLLELRARKVPYAAIATDLGRSLGSVKGRGERLAKNVASI